MTNKKVKSIRILNINYKEKDGVSLSSGYTLRTTIGVLGMLLPILLWIVVKIDSSYSSPLFSISHYYYTRAASVFVLVLGMMGIFLLIYKGWDPIDFWISSLAGLAALMVVLFPTDNLINDCPGVSEKYSVTLLNDNDFRIGFHYASAGVFIICLACMSIFLFTKTDKNKKNQSTSKKIRNALYIICGSTMIIAILVVFLGQKFHLIDKDFYQTNHLTFWMETLAVECFGIAWFVKGRKWEN